MFASHLCVDGSVEITTLSANEEYIVRIPLGYDTETQDIISLFVALAPLAGYADVPGMELVFNITAANRTHDQVRTWWDGAETKPILEDPAIRAMVRSLLHRAVEVLIDEAAPSLVSMTTHEAHLPPKALTKFREICAIFAAKGFKAGKADSWHGRHVWMMHKER